MEYYSPIRACLLIIHTGRFLVPPVVKHKVFSLHDVKIVDTDVTVYNVVKLWPRGWD